MPKIKIKGPIISNNDQWIYDYFDIEATSPKMVNALIDDADGDDLEVEINSGGGSVFAGSEIYTALKSYSGKVNVRIVGIAASAASVIAMAGDNVAMSPTAQLMIHNVSAYAEGDHREMQHTSDVLKSANQTVANAYRIKTGKTQEELLQLMDDETWMTAERASELGFVDEIMFEDEVKLVAIATVAEMLPPEVVEKMRNKLTEEKAIKAAEARLRLLNLERRVENG